MKNRFGTVVVVPFWSQADNMNLDSNYVYLRVILPHFERLTEDTIFLVLFPDPKYGQGNWKFVPDGLRSDRIKLIPWPYDTQMQTSVSGFDVKRFYEIDTHFAPAIYWINQVEMGPFLYGGYHKSYASVVRPTLVAQHHYIIHRSLPYVYESNFTRQWLQIGGSLASDAVICNSEHCKNMMIESFGEYLSNDKMEELKGKTSVIPFGFVGDDFTPAPLATKEDKPVILYNHRFENYKQPNLTWEVFTELKNSHDFEIWVTQLVGQQTGGHKKNYFFDQYVFEASRQAYLKRIAVPAINTINSMHETFCIAMMDSIMLGHLPVVPDGLTFPELVPEGYPFLFKNQKEQLAMFDQILKDWPKDYNKWHDILIDHAKKKFSIYKYAEDYIEKMAEAENSHLTTVTKPHILSKLNNFWDKFPRNKVMPIAEVALQMKKETKLGMQAMTNCRVVREALRMREDVHIIWQNGIAMIKD